MLQLSSSRLGSLLKLANSTRDWSLKIPKTNAASRLSASKNPSCPIARSAESRPHERDSHSTEQQPIFRGALDGRVVAEIDGVVGVLRGAQAYHLEQGNDFLRMVRPDRDTSWAAAAWRGSRGSAH